ncbi:MAG: PD-(D/E)XK nuclease family protein [Rikenellaceae bacterium]
MSSFLSELAAELYERHGDGVSNLNIIFPSRRARLFFQDALAGLLSRPLWQPRYRTIDEMMQEGAGIYVGERVRLIAELYKVYSKYHAESFDRFYFWGEVLLADFDMIDKYMVDAKMLFANVADIKELEADLSYLTTEQIEIINKFWGTFHTGKTLSGEQSKFISIWSSLADIYHEYRARLLDLGFGYAGMVHRLAVERLASDEASIDATYGYVAAGFNALSKCETKLFDHLKSEARAEFYWDYDNYYVENREQEAGMFIRDNIFRFPPSGKISCDNFLRDKTIYSIATASNALQCRYVETIISELAQSEKIDKQTAIVLTDENLLTPLLYALPKSIGGVNVTMGYPLRLSLAYSFLERLVELQKHRRLSRSGSVQFYHEDVVGLISHPYLHSAAAGLSTQLVDEIVGQRMIYVDGSLLGRSEIYSEIFVARAGWQSITDYLISVIDSVLKLPRDISTGDEIVEFLVYMADEIASLRESLLSCEIELSDEIYYSLLRRYLQSLRIPYEGEPLEGVQVMGILETRNLDFKNVILLSMNDDNFPGNRTWQHSYIPQGLRAAYSLPTPEHHEGVFGYYFYRLIQRAERVWMVYSSHADEKSTGEASRYIYQLDYETDFKILRSSVGVDVSLAERREIVVQKRGEVAKQLARFTDLDSPQAISPTALFRYIACPLRFYFYSLAKIKSGDELNDELDASMFGNILHSALQSIYDSVVGVVNPDFAALKIKVEGAVEAAIGEHYLKGRDTAVDDYSGNLLLIKEIVCKYIKNGVLNYDSKNGGFVVEALESSVDLPIELASGERVVVGGVVDRLDTLDGGKLRVVDYKSGAMHTDFSSIEDLFNGDGKARQSNIIQTMLYSMILNKRRDREVLPSLYYVRAMHRDDYSPLLVDRSRKANVEAYSLYAEEFEGYIKEKLTELFDRSTPFVQCEDKSHTCAYCDYKAICGLESH